MSLIAIPDLHLGGDLLLPGRNCALAETVLRKRRLDAVNGERLFYKGYLEFPGQGLKVSAAASSGCPAALSLGGPIVC
jgi:hypothetical protein